jgi:hypothetical protein
MEGYPGARRGQCAAGEADAAPEQIDAKRRRAPRRAGKRDRDLARPRIARTAQTEEERGNNSTMPRTDGRQSTYQTMKERAGAAKVTFLEETVALEAGARATLTLEAARAKDIVIWD